MEPAAHENAVLQTSEMHEGKARERFLWVMRIVLLPKYWIQFLYSMCSAVLPLSISHFGGSVHLLSFRGSVSNFNFDPIFDLACAMSRLNISYFFEDNVLLYPHVLHNS